MKVQYKVLISILIIVISAIGFYFYKRAKYMTLNPEDRAIIEKSFGKDSNGKGYSDEGHRLMMEDLNNVKMSEQDKKELTTLYKFILTQKRKTALSPDRESFLKNRLELGESRRCWTLWAMKNTDRTVHINYFDDQGQMGDNEALRDYLNILTEKYLNSIPEEEAEKIINPEVSEEYCRKFL